MRVYACIPTFNESSNIKEITRVVDRGMQLLAKKYGATVFIVNADSASTDNTVEKFEATTTITPKITIKNQTKGKGVNLLKFIDLAAHQDADFCLTIDADITSASPNWVLDLLEPVIQGRADFVAPLYQRDRFGASITIHFAYPTIRAFTGQSIRQPIGGEFAFNRRFIELVQTTDKPAAVYSYGIDIFWTFLAASSCLRIVQTPLGQKVHAPGLGKIEGMFPQVAEAAGFMARQVRRTQRTDVSPELPVGIAEMAVYPSESDLKALYGRAKNRLQNLSAWLPSSAVKYAKGVQNTDDFVFLSQENWSKILVAWYEQVLSGQSSDIPKLAQELLPFFVLRTMGFWSEIGSLTPVEIEKKIQAQAAEVQLLVRSQ